MDHVFAKIKGHGKKLIFKLISNHTLFNIGELDANFCVEYTPDHNLDEDAWFKVEEFSQKPFCLDFLKENFDSKDHDDLRKDQFTKIAYIFSVQENDFYFQKISPSLFICKKSIAFGEVAKIEEGENRLIINNQPDAIYFKDLDMLVFKSLPSISGIFKGIDELYKEATNDEVGEFLGESFISLGAGFGVQSVSKPNRKRIALAMASLANMTPQDRSDMLTYINDYCNDKLSLDAASGKFEVTKDDELKLLLYGVEQRFYTTPFGKQKRLANSVQDVG